MMFMPPGTHLRRKPPDRRVAWRETAALLDGRLEEGRRPSKDVVVVRHGPWVIALDTYTQSQGNHSVTYTRVRAYAAGWRGLTLSVRRRNVLDRVAAALGLGGGRPAVSPALQERWVVRGKPAARIPSLFAGTDLAQAIQALPAVSLRVRRPSWWSRRCLPDGTVEVVARARGVIDDVTRLAGMIRVVAETLVGLERVGEIRWEEVVDSKERTG